VDNTSGKETSRITISIGLVLYLYKSTEFSNLMTPWHAFDNKMTLQLRTILMVIARKSS
jgi:hypothetical protein